MLRLISTLILAFCLGIIGISLITGCATTQTVAAEPANTCDPRAIARVKAKAKEGYVMVQSGAEVLSDGVAVAVIMVHAKRGLVYVDLQLDSEAALREVGDASIKRTGTCVRGGRTWIEAQATVANAKGEDA